MSEELHCLVHTLANSRLDVAELVQGVVGQSRGKSRAGQLALLVGSLRRRLYLLAVRSQARLLLDRLEGLVGDGASDAARRRAAAVTAERSLMMERRAQAVSLRQGRKIVRRGFFKLD